MKAYIILGLMVFMAAFAGIFYLNYQPGEKINFKPPYHYVPGEPLSYANAFFFVFVFSLLMIPKIGSLAPIALGIEGTKYASLLSLGKMPVTDLLFVAPQVIAAYSAAVLAQGVVDDLDEKQSLTLSMQKAVKYLIVAVILFAAVLFGIHYMPTLPAVK
jgi:hypothetical protein